jgi:hypothetical protein
MQLFCSLEYSCNIHPSVASRGSSGQAIERREIEHMDVAQPESPS